MKILVMTVPKPSLSTTFYSQKTWMLGEILTILTLCSFWCTPLIGFAESNLLEQKWGSLIVDTSIQYGQLSISDSAVPAAMKTEAANPTIVNPYSGNTFSGA